MSNPSPSRQEVRPLVARNRRSNRHRDRADHPKAGHLRAARNRPEVAGLAEGHSQEARIRAGRNLHREVSRRAVRSHLHRGAARQAAHIHQKGCQAAVPQVDRNRAGNLAVVRRVGRSREECRAAIPVADPNLRVAVRQAVLPAAVRRAVLPAAPNLQEAGHQADNHQAAIPAAGRSHHLHREARRAAVPTLRADHHQVDNRHRPIRAPSRSASARSPLGNLER